MKRSNKSPTIKFSSLGKNYPSITGQEAIDFFDAYLSAAAEAEQPISFVLYCSKQKNYKKDSLLITISNFNFYGTNFQNCKIVGPIEIENCIWEDSNIINSIININQISISFFRNTSHFNSQICFSTTYTVYLLNCIFFNSELTSHLNNDLKLSNVVRYDSKFELPEEGLETSCNVSIKSSYERSMKLFIRGLNNFHASPHKTNCESLVNLHNICAAFKLGSLLTDESTKELASVINKIEKSCQFMYSPHYQKFIMKVEDMILQAHDFLAYKQLPNFKNGPILVKSLRDKLLLNFPGDTYKQLSQVNQVCELQKFFLEHLKEKIKITEKVSNPMTELSKMAEQVKS